MERELALYIGCLELNLALRTDEPPTITATSTTLEIAKHERWERSNRLSLMYMQSHIAKGIRGSVPEYSKAKDFLKPLKHSL
jgi:hypothetical protein